MGPLAGKPPFATDEPDSFYESSPAPQRRVRHPAPPNPNDRSSAYNVYDNYLGPDNPNAGSASNRQSGVGALGMGLLNMSDSDDDSDNEDSQRKSPPSQSKHAALATATGSAAWPPPPRSSSKHAMNPDSHSAHPPTIVAPRPGYAAPIAALNLAQSDNVTKRAPPPEPIAVPTPVNPFEPPMAQVYNSRGLPMPRSPLSLGPPSTPHPLQPPVTPITPVFARPGKAAIAFSEPIPRNKPIMRSGTEDVLLPRRGEKGDDFWRRFSMVAKTENRKSYGSKESWWLKKTQSGSSRLSRWVWVLAVVLILAITAASVIGWQVSKNKPSDGAPTAFGGSANQRSSSVAASTTATAATSSIKHVSPTHTVARRGGADATATLVPHGHAQTKAHRKRLFKVEIAV